MDSEWSPQSLQQALQVERAARVTAERQAAHLQHQLEEGAFRLVELDAIVVELQSQMRQMAGELSSARRRAHNSEASVVACTARAVDAEARYHAEEASREREAWGRKHAEETYNAADATARRRRAQTASAVDDADITLQQAIAAANGQPWWKEADCYLMAVRAERKLLQGEVERYQDMAATAQRIAEEAGRQVGERVEEGRQAVGQAEASLRQARAHQVQAESQVAQQAATVTELRLEAQRREAEMNTMRDMLRQEQQARQVLEQNVKTLQAATTKDKATLASVHAELELSNRNLRDMKESLGEVERLEWKSAVDRERDVTKHWQIQVERLQQQVTHSQATSTAALACSEGVAHNLRQELLDKAVKCDVLEADLDRERSVAAALRSTIATLESRDVTTAGQPRSSAPPPYIVVTPTSEEELQRLRTALELKDTQVTQLRELLRRQLDSDLSEVQQTRSAIARWTSTVQEEGTPATVPGKRQKHVTLSIT